MIVCDTNIWYGLGSGKISESSVKNLELACTNITLRELCSTPNIITDFPSFRNAVLAIQKHAKIFYWGNAFDYARLRLLPNYFVKIEDGKRMWQYLQTFIQTALTGDEIAKQKAFVDEKNNSNLPFIQLMNALRDQVNTNIKANGIKSKRKKEDTSMKTKEFLSEMLSDRDNGVIINKDMDAWEHLEFLVQVLTRFFREVELLDNGKVHYNDIPDFWNLAYVGNNDLYWTHDSKWVRIAENNPIAAKYIYQPKTNTASLG